MLSTYMYVINIKKEPPVESCMIRYTYIKYLHMHDSCLKVELFGLQWILVSMKMLLFLSVLQLLAVPAFTVSL